jgi:hypothetical protein
MWYSWICPFFMDCVLYISLLLSAVYVLACNWKLWILCILCWMQNYDSFFDVGILLRWVWVWVWSLPFGVGGKVCFTV